MSVEFNEAIKAFRLDGRVAVITGGGSGLGREAARMFSLAGARVVLVDVNERGMADTAARISRADTLCLRVDVSDHNMTNLYVFEKDGETRVLSKWFALNPPDAGLLLGDYEDLVVRTPEGWRIRHRLVRLRYPAPSATPHAGPGAERLPPARYGTEQVFSDITVLASTTAPLPERDQGQSK